MIAEQKTHRLVRSHDFDEAEFGIDQEDIGFVIDLLRNQIYSNKILAVVREYTVNAVDAHKEIGKPNLPICVNLPTRFNPHFTVRDYGNGLSHDDICNIYVRYCKSTKRQSNAFTGQLGIGCKSGFAYGDSFTVTSFHKGIKTTYVAQIDETSQGKIIKMDETESKEKSGIEIKIAVADEDIHSFQQEALKLFKYFEVKPKVTGHDGKIEEFKKILEGDDWYLVERENSYGYHARSSNRAIAIMGNIGYPIDTDAIKGINEHQTSILEHGELHIEFGIGELSVAPSREALEYTRKTQATIKDKAKSVIKALQRVASEKLKNSGDLWEAKVNYNTIYNTFDHSLRDVLKDCFTFKGLKVNDARFDIPQSVYNWQNPHVNIRKYELNSVGKLKTSKERHIFCQENTLLVESDVANNSGLTARIRHLFNEDSDLKNVYFVDFDTRKTRKTFYDHNNWQHLAKDRVKMLSDIPKAIVNKASGNSQGVTRSHISAFVFEHKDSDTGSGDSQYWQDADNIDPQKDSGVYAPLWRYCFMEKPDNVSELRMTNSEIQNALNYINKNKKDKDKIKVYGFRFRDIEKLNKSKWTRLDDYFKTFVQEYFKGEEGQDALQALSNIFELGKHDEVINEVEHDSKLGQFLAKKLPEKHRLGKLINFENVKNSLRKKYEDFLIFYNTFLKNESKHKIFDIKLPKSDYNIVRSRKRMNSLYPMIGYTNQYRWSFDKKMAEDILNYINIVDKFHEQTNIFTTVEQKKA